MDRIAAQALVSVATAAEELGYSRAEMYRATGLDPGRLEDAWGHCLWAEYTRLFAALEAAGAAASDFRDLGRRTTTSPELHRAVRITRAFLTPRALHLGYIRWVLPRNFPLLGVRWQSEDKLRLRLHLRVPDGQPVHHGFFYYIQGCAEAATQELGLPPAKVTLAITGRGADYLIRLPPDRTVWNRIRIFGRAMFRSETFIAELGEQQREINEYYEALLRTRRNFQHLIEKLPDAVVVHRDGAVIYANAAAADVLGLERASDLVGRRILDIVHAEERERAAEIFAGAPGPGFEPLRGRRPDGRELLLDAAPTQTVEFDDREASLSLLRDVTERRRLEEQLVAADRLSSLGAVSAGVAHELNNPLAYVALNLRTLAHATEGIGEEGLQARAQEALAAARHGVERATTIVRDLNSFSRPERDSVEVVDLRDALDRALGMLARDTTSRARIVRRYGAPASVLANRARMEQVFVNLILNAMQSFGDDDPEVNEVVLEVSTEGDRAVAAVADNGCGIPDDVRPRIFDPLFTTKPVGEGTGLGLSICHGIVAAAGGSIDVHAPAEGGTAFRVTLPLAEPRAADRSASSGTRAALPRRRILVVDDEPALLRALRMVLGEFHDVEAESNGRDALERLRRDPPFDLILCDLIMSGMSGMDLYRELERDDPELTGRIVFMTGGANTHRARGFLEETTHRVLEKPFHFDKLLQYVEECIAARGTARASEQSES